MVGNIASSVNGAIMTVETAAVDRRKTGLDVTEMLDSDDALDDALDSKYAAYAKAEADASATLGAELTPIS